MTNAKKTNNSEAKLLKLKKEGSHKKWISRQQAYREIARRNNYDFKSRAI